MIWRVLRKIMEILKEIKRVQETYREIQEKQEALSKQMQSNQNEMLSLNGEYRLLVREGVKQGLLDENGNIIEKEVNKKQK
jgi:hypothetical protein